MKKQNLKFIGLIFLIFAILILIFTTNLKNLSPDSIRDTVESYGILAPIAFIILYIILVNLFIPGTLITLVGGALFGTFLGTIYTVIAATIGASLAFIIARFLGGEYVNLLLEKRFKKLYNYDKKFKKHGILIVLFLRLIPLFPFTGLNYALGLTKVKFKDYFIATLIGIIPGTFAYAYLGDSLAELSIINIIISIALIIILASILPIYKKLNRKKMPIKKNEI